MLHLAQVREQEPGGKLKLVLLAQQKFEHMWTLLPAPDEISVTGSPNYNVGALVLVDLDSSREVQAFQDATAWVLTFVEQYLSLGIPPDVLNNEVERAEEWRRTLTLQSQEHSRRSLEMEARRDQIQELEENLKREKRQLEVMTAEIKELEETLKQEKKQLEEMAAEIKANGHCPCQSNDSQPDPTAEGENFTDTEASSDAGGETSAEPDVDASSEVKFQAESETDADPDTPPDQDGS